MATALEGQLIGCRSDNPNALDPPDYLSITRIAFQMTSSRSSQTMIVNKLNTTPKKDQKPYEYKNKVQCKACGLFGLAWNTIKYVDF